MTIDQINYINLTPHVINEATSGLSFMPEPVPARVSVQYEEVYSGVIPLYKTVYGEVVGLPPQIENTKYIVSLLVCQASKRNDLVSPGELIRDDYGNPIGCKGFIVK